MKLERLSFENIRKLALQTQNIIDDEPINNSHFFTHEPCRNISCNNNHIRGKITFFKKMVDKYSCLWYNILCS